MRDFPTASSPGRGVFNYGLKYNMSYKAMFSHIIYKIAKITGFIKVYSILISPSPVPFSFLFYIYESFEYMVCAPPACMVLTEVRKGVRAHGNGVLDGFVNHLLRCQKLNPASLHE